MENLALIVLLLLHLAPPGIHSRKEQAHLHPRHHHCRLWGERRGEVTLLSSLSSLSHEDDDVGQREGSGDNFDDCGGGEVASWLSLRGMGKEKGGMAATSDGEGGRGHTVLVSFCLLDLAVKQPHSLSGMLVLEGGSPNNQHSL